MAKKSLPNFCAVVVLWQQYGPHLDGEPDPSGIPLLFTVPLPLPAFSVPLSPTFFTL